MHPYFYSRKSCKYNDTSYGRTNLDKENKARSS